MGHHSHRTVTTLQGVTRLILKVYRCHNTACSRFHQPTRPEEEGQWALPHGEFGLDVIALVGMLRYHEPRSIPQIHEALLQRGVCIAPRTVTDQLYRYEELLALHLADSRRLQERLKEQKQVILALDGLQPDVGHEVLWVLRDCCSGEVLLARSLLGATEQDLVPRYGGSGYHLHDVADPHCRSHFRRAALQAPRGGTCEASHSPPVVSIPLFARSRQTDCRCRPAR